MPRPNGPLSQPYLLLKNAVSLDIKSNDTSQKILNLVITALDFLKNECEEVELISQVEGKSYHSFRRKKGEETLSRPVNDAMFSMDKDTLISNWNGWAGGNHFKDTPSLWYTIATAYGVASDLFDRNNKKGPATYFEMLIGHIFAKSFDSEPTKSARLNVDGRQVLLTMDFLFELNKGRPNIHLPVKMSTRERVVQAWAHQRLLDVSYGIGNYIGLLVVHSETKLDLVTKEVVEICVPDQWLAYQSLLSKMERIYYFDVPNRYLELARDFPIIQLKQFSHFFEEMETVLARRS